MSDYGDDSDYQYTQSYYDDYDSYNDPGVSCYYDEEHVNGDDQVYGTGPIDVLYNNYDENVETVGYLNEVYDTGGQNESYYDNGESVAIFGQGYDGGPSESYYEDDEPIHPPVGYCEEVYDSDNGQVASYYDNEEDNSVAIFGHGYDDGPSESDYNDEEPVGHSVGYFEEVYDADDGQNASYYDNEEDNSVAIFGQGYEDDPSESDEDRVEHSVGYFQEVYDDGENASYYDIGQYNGIAIFGQDYYEDEDDGPSIRSFADLYDDGSSNTYIAPQSIEQMFSGLTLREPDRRSASSTKEHKSNNQIVNMPSGSKATISRPVHSPCQCSRNCVGQSMTLTTLTLGLGGDYELIHAEMHKTLGAHNFSQYNIKSIIKVGNCCLWEKFRKREKQIAEEFGRVNERMLFHGSSAADAIVKTGFDISRANPAGMFGPGVYFAEHSSKSNIYAAGYLGHRKMLICRVALGNMLDRTQADKMKKPPAGYHSVRGVPTSGGLLYPEYVVYHNDQAYPEYIVSYNIQ